MPRFLVDESTGKGVAEELSRLGFDTVYVGDFLKGSKDEEVIRHAYAEKRVLVTNDKDFGGLVYRKKMRSRGIVLLRLEDEHLVSKLRLLRILIENFQEKIENKFVVVTEDKIRFRKL